MKTLLLTVSIILLITLSSFAQSAKISWDANTEPDLLGYKIYYGFHSGDYNVTLDVGDTTSYSIGLTYDFKFYFAVTAYDTAGNESNYSDEVSITLTKPDTTAPIPPGGIIIQQIGDNNIMTIEINPN